MQDPARAKNVKHTNQGAQTRVQGVPWFEIVWNIDILLMLYTLGHVWFQPHRGLPPNPERRRRYYLEEARAANATVNANDTTIPTSKHTGIGGDNPSHHFPNNIRAVT
jgi:hypothetical protein